MKHALLVGVPEQDSSGQIDEVPGVDAMSMLLRDLGGWSVTVCTGRDATRARVLRALGAMLSVCRAEDTCLFYFFGHGGVVKFSGVSGELGARTVFYLATLRPLGSHERVGVLDIEISDTLTRLDRACGNVTAIIDCCHAASMVRDGLIPIVPAPQWVKEVSCELGDGRQLLLAAQSHPRIVRLFGSSSQRSAYATQQPEGRYGLMTQSIVETIREAGLRCGRLTWDTVAHRAREWASRQRGTEEQRVVLAGPRHRVLFSREVAPQLRSAAFVPGPTSGRGWIRAGALQGVRVGDCWGITELELGAGLQPRFEVDARVQSVGLDASEVVLSTPSSRPPLGATAVLGELGEPLPVLVDAVPEFDAVLQRSGLVRAVTSDASWAIARVRRAALTTAAVDILDGGGHPLWLGAPIDADTLRSVVELLEDRAQAHRFSCSLAAASSRASSDTEVVWEWGTFGAEDELLPMPCLSPSAGPVPRIRAGDRLWLRLGHRGTTPRRWFVSVLLVNVEGRLVLLNTHEPEGIEVVPGEVTFVGRRGHRQRQGMTCTWPSRVPRRAPRQERLIIVASRRPLSVSHLVRLPEPDDPNAFAAQGLGFGVETVVRSEDHPPFITTGGWAWDEVVFEIDPCSGPSLGPVARGA